MTPRVRIPSTVILGLVPRIQLSAGDKLGNRGATGQRGIQVDPMRVGAFDQVDLPGARIELEGLFALDRLADVRELLVPDEHVHAASAGEDSALTGGMLLDAE